MTTIPQLSQAMQTLLTTTTDISAATLGYVQRPAFRDGVAALGMWYFTSVSYSTLISRRPPALIVQIWSGKGRKPIRPQRKTPTNQPYRADTLLTRLPKTAWLRAIMKEEIKGPIVCDIACVRVTDVRQSMPGVRQWLVIRRAIADPTAVSFFLSNTPAEITIAELIRLCGMCWPMELAMAPSHAADAPFFGLGAGALA